MRRISWNGSDSQWQAEEAGLKRGTTNIENHSIIMVLHLLFKYQEGADRQGIHTGAVEAAHGGAWVGDKGLAEEIETSVDQDGGGSSFAKFVEKLPEERVRLFFDRVNANRGAIECETFEARERVF